MDTNPAPWAGICVTPCPTRWRGNPDTDRTYEAECEGLKGDPNLEHDIKAQRVRLVRALDEDEVLEGVGGLEPGVPGTKR